MKSEILKYFVSIFPSYDPYWSQELTDKWFNVFNRLIEEAEKLDNQNMIRILKKRKEPIILGKLYYRCNKVRKVIDIYPIYDLHPYILYVSSIWMTGKHKGKTSLISLNDFYDWIEGETDEDRLPAFEEALLEN